MDQWGGYHIIYMCVYIYIPAARHLLHAATSKTCIQLEFCASLEPGFRNNYATCPQIDLLNKVSHVLLYMWYETGMFAARSPPHAAMFSGIARIQGLWGLWQWAFHRNFYGIWRGQAWICRLWGRDQRDGA